jgi:hypothetical protein
MTALINRRTNLRRLASTYGWTELATSYIAGFSAIAKFQKFLLICGTWLISSSSVEFQSSVQSRRYAWLVPVL